MAISDLELRKKELKQAAYLHSTQHKHHAAEAARHERELDRILARLDEIEQYLLPHAAAKQSVGKTKKASDARSGNPSSSAYQRFRSEGPTTVIVRLLYENKAGMAMFEMQARNGLAIRARIIRKITNRLIEAGCARREGDNILLTDEGIRSWEASPLFLHSRREGQSRAS